METPVGYREKGSLAVKLPIKAVPRFIRALAYDAVVSAVHRVDAEDIARFKYRLLEAVAKALAL